jgi:hypothetical protein
MKSNDSAKARAEAAFRKVAKPGPDATEEASVPANDQPVSQSRPVETTEGAMDEYLARQLADRAKMAKLRALRLAAEAKVGVKLEGKGKGKRR